MPSSAVELEFDVVSSPETNKAATQVQALVRGRADRKSAEEDKAAKLRAEAAALQQQQLMEAERKQPILAINTAIYWHALRKNGIADKVPGWGSLLERY